MTNQGSQHLHSDSMLMDSCDLLFLTPPFWGAESSQNLMRVLDFSLEEYTGTSSFRLETLTGLISCVAGNSCFSTYLRSSTRTPGCRSCCLRTWRRPLSCGSIWISVPAVWRGLGKNFLTRAFQKGVSLLRAKSRDTEDTANTVGQHLLTDQGEPTLFGGQ